MVRLLFLADIGLEYQITRYNNICSLSDQTTMSAPTNVPAETAVAATMEATTAPSGMKMLFETRQTKHMKLHK